MKKLIATLLTLTLLATTMVTAFAADPTVPVTMTVEPQIFDVTVPLILPVTLTSTGEVQVANNAAIVNNSSGPVKITAINTIGKNGWTTADYTGLDIKSAKVGSKDIGFSFKLAGSETKTTGKDANDFAGSVVLVKGESLPLIYNAKVAAQKEASAGTQIAEVVFTIGWDE